MAALQHRFIRGLRATTDLQYSAKTPRRTQYADLFVPPMPADCGLSTVLQTLMILEGLPRVHVDRLKSPQRSDIRTLVSLAFEHPPHRGCETNLLRYLPGMPGIRGEVMDEVQPMHLEVVNEAIVRGAVPIVELSNGHNHWYALVTGVELGVDYPTPKALLLLDPKDPPPWACFYNTRIDLSPDSQANQEADTNDLPCRALDGGMRSVQLRTITFFRRAK